MRARVAARDGASCCWRWQGCRSSPACDEPARAYLPAAQSVRTLPRACVGRCRRGCRPRAQTAPDTTPRATRYSFSAFVALGLAFIGFIAAAWVDVRPKLGQPLKAGLERCADRRTGLLARQVVCGSAIYGSRRSCRGRSGRLAVSLWRWIDTMVLIDGTVNLTGLGMQVLGEVLRMFQTGLTRNYALVLFLGSLAAPGLRGVVTMDFRPCSLDRVPAALGALVVHWLTPAGAVALQRWRWRWRFSLRRARRVSLWMDMRCSIPPPRRNAAPTESVLGCRSGTWATAWASTGCRSCSILLTTLLTPTRDSSRPEHAIQKRVKAFLVSMLVLETGMLGVFVSRSIWCCSTCSGRSCWFRWP